jgi:hypothetical protein
MDKLEELSKRLGGKIKVQDIFNWNFKDKATRRLIVKNYKNFNVEIIEYGNILQICINLRSEFTFRIEYIFAINNIEKLCFLVKEIEVANFPYKVFISNTNSNPTLISDLLFIWEDFSLRIKEIKLLPHESIFIYKNCLSIALDSTRDIVPILNDIINSINNNDILVKDTRKKILSKNIPDNLKHLIPLLKKWCIADDGFREQLIEETGEKQKRKLIKTIEPYLREINEFLDSFQDNPLSDEAILLGNLAEFISELQVDNQQSS